MTTFPSITGSRLIRALRKFGFEAIRIKGSHHFLQHQDGRNTVETLSESGSRGAPRSPYHPACGSTPRAFPLGTHEAIHRDYRTVRTCPYMTAQ